MKLKLYFISLFVFFLNACSVEPEPINWGKDACHYCKMNIVDKMHAAEYVSTKGKVFKYDAIECLVNDLIRHDFPDRKYTLVSDYGNDGEFTDASQSTYLISEKIRSPMGGFLSAFLDNSVAVQTHLENAGKLLTWDELILEYKGSK